MGHACGAVQCSLVLVPQQKHACPPFRPPPTAPYSLTTRGAPNIPKLRAVKGGYYGSSPTDGAQTAQAHALGAGVVPPGSVGAVAAYLMNDIAQHNNHLSVGIIGMKHLMRSLTATGNAYTAVNISLQTDYPSFGYTFNHEYEPATTLWERTYHNFFPQNNLPPN